MPDQSEIEKNLRSLGVGEGSKVERIKAESQQLQGQIAEELAQDTTHFSEAQIQLMKFHGVYQQENRDVRHVRKAGEEKAYQFMIRTRIPGGVVTADQYLVHDTLADRYGNGAFRVTTRQGFQLHGVLKGDLHATIHTIHEALLSTLAACGDVNRNVMACPAPHCGVVHAQIEQIAHNIAQHLAPRSRAYAEIWVDGEKFGTEDGNEGDEQESEPIYGKTYLPRKFKIGIAAPGDNCIDIYTQDIGLIAVAEHDQLEGFILVIGGGMGMTHGKSETFPRLATPLCFVTPDEVIAVVEAIVTVQRDYGDRQNRKHARMKYLVEERGVDWFRAEVESRLGYQLQDARPIVWESAEEHLGWHAQGDGTWYLGLFIENGRIKDDDAIRLRTGLRHVVEIFRPGIRLTSEQNILLTDIPEAQRGALTALLESNGIPTDPADLGTRRFAMACPALPTCGLALAEAERVLPDIMDEVEAELRALDLAHEPLSVRMTGCPNGCARPYLGDIGIVGRTKDVYNVYIGGDPLNTRLNTLYAPSVHRKDILPTVRPLLALWKQERLPAESFGDYCTRVGFDYLRTQAQVVVAHA
jgi:sulfite reductase (ferredoxin)